MISKTDETLLQLDNLADFIEKLDEIKIKPGQIGILSANAQVLSSCQEKLRLQYPTANYTCLQATQLTPHLHCQAFDLLVVPFFNPEAFHTGEAELEEAKLTWPLFYLQSKIKPGGLLLLSSLSIETNLPCTLPKQVLPELVDALQKTDYAHPVLDVDRIQYPEGKWVLAYAIAWKRDRLESWASPCDNEGTVFMPLDKIKPLNSV